MEGGDHGRCMKTRWKARRRGFLLGGLGAGVAGLFPMLLDESPVRMNNRGKVGGIGGAVVPPTVVNLADYGGIPGAGKAILTSAFGQAFAALARSGGGTLLVPAGVYDFGSQANAASIISCRNLNNIAISAYGATFKANTTTTVVPHFFYFFNFYNVTIAGASFNDPGFTPWVNWRGMYCVGIQADKASSGFRMVDCYAERVLGLFATNNNAATRNFLSDVSVQGEVHYAYYGVGASFIREHVNVDLVCHNVRRAFIAYSLKNANITVTSSSTSNWPGSNGLVALVSGGASMGSVENVRVKVNTSGACIHSCYVHFYHQGPEIEGCMRDIDATVNVINADSTPSLFVFDHETNGVQAKTGRRWDQISLHGSVTGKFTGKIISNTSVATSPGTVYVDANLAEQGNVKSLPAGFRIHSP
jgi:hypothetical protein